MATNNAINLATPTSNTLSVTQSSGALAVNTLAVLQTDTGFASWSGAGAYFDDTTLGTFIKIYINTTAYYIPYFLTIAP